MDTLSAMRAFVEIVDRGSLTAAADSLGRSQPTMVRTLASLEAHLGARLLRRTTRRMSLTAEGRDYLARCRQILVDVEEAERAVGQDEGDPRGEVRITAPVQFGQMHIAPALPGFLERYRQVRVDLVLLDRIVDLVEEGFDMALRIGPLTDSSMIAVRLGAVHSVICASPALLAKVGTPTTLADLSGKPCIRTHNLPRGSVWRFRDNGRACETSVDGRFVCNQVAAARNACTDGIGFCQFLSYQVHNELETGALVRVLADFQPPAAPISLVYPGGRLVSARQRALQNWLKQYLAGKFA